VDEPGVVTADMTPTPTPIETSTAAVSRRKARTPRIFPLETSPQGVGQPGHTAPEGGIENEHTTTRQTCSEGTAAAHRLGREAWTWDPDGLAAPCDMHWGAQSRRSVLLARPSCYLLARPSSTSLPARS